MIKSWEYIITNVLPIESDLGGGQHRLLDLAISLARYTTITGNEFLSHANPGAPAFPSNLT